MLLIRVPDEIVNKLIDVANSQGKPLSDYVAEIFGQANRAHELNCSLKDTVDLYERTIIKKETAGEVEPVEEPSIDKVFERTLAKLRPEMSESQEHRMLDSFLSHLSRSIK